MIFTFECEYATSTFTCSALRSVVEAGGAAHEWPQPAVGEPRGDADGVLLGDAALHELPWQLGGKRRSALRSPGCRW